MILAYVTYNLVYALGSYPAGVSADRPRSAAFGIGMMFFAIGYVGLGLTRDHVTAWLLIGVYGLFTACTDGVGKAWISSLVGADRQSTAQGIFRVAAALPFWLPDCGPACCGEPTGAIAAGVRNRRSVFRSRPVGAVGAVRLGTEVRLVRRIHVIGIGAGDPDYVTAQAVRALNDTEVFFAMDKGEAKSDLPALRRGSLPSFHLRIGLPVRRVARPAAGGRR